MPSEPNHNTVAAVRYRPSRASSDRVSLLGVLPPTMLILQPSGSVIAYYGEQPLTEFRTFDAALRYHRLTLDDLEVLDD